MREVSQSEFDAVVMQAETESAELATIGSDVAGVTTKGYAPLTGGAATLVEYYAAGSMFGFVQDGRYYTNGL